MPELPEVETTIRYLRPRLVNNPIADIYLNQHGLSIFDISEDELKDNLIGNVVTSINRQGKFILVEFKRGNRAVAHLRMSGRYLVSQEPSTNKHNHFSLILNSGDHVHYIDQRRFGTFHFVDEFSNYPGLQRLGIDALNADISPQYLRDQWQRRNVPVYTALLDQSTIAGLGNIYVNEILYRAKIHPLTPVKQLNIDEVTNIVSEIKPVLNQSLELKGTTLIDNLYQDPEGKTGQFAKLLNVYGRANQSCRRCGSPIERLKIGGRSVFFCPNCQILQL